MNYLIDTHSHIYAEEFDADRDEAIRRAREAGWERLLLPAIDSESHGRLFDTVRRYPDHCTLDDGAAPASINDNPPLAEELALVERYLCSSPKASDDSAPWAKSDSTTTGTTASRPNSSRHSRNSAAWPRPMTFLSPSIRGRPGKICAALSKRKRRPPAKRAAPAGVFHAFAEDADTYRQLKECGDFLFGIGGVVTFKKSRLADTVREMELDDLVLETDCPYLTPVPYRGQRNESGYIPYICNKIAALKGTTPEEVAAATTRNARRMFGFDAARQTTNDHSSPTESI